VSRMPPGVAGGWAAAPPLRTGMPLVVLSKTKPFPLPAGQKGVSAARLRKVWNQTQNELPALEPGTPHMIATGSDHYIQVREPDRVIAATRLAGSKPGLLLNRRRHDDDHL
jgi:hypothetical protein